MRALLIAVVVLASSGCLEELSVLGEGGPVRDSGTPFDATPPDAAVDSGAPAIATRGVAAGVSHSCAIFAGELYCWGAGGAGQLGLGDTADRNTPERVGSRTDWVQVVAGEDHSCGLVTSGDVFCWGDNGSGQLGTGDTTSSTTPVRSLLPEPVLYVDVGYRHSCAIAASDRSLYCWGHNSEGQLGLDDAVDRPTPTRIDTSVRWAQVALGDASSITLDVDGGIWGWGRNSQSQLGLGTGAPMQRRSPTFIADGPFELIAATQNTSGAVAGGDIHAWGWNGSAQLGDGTRTNQDAPVQITTGRAFDAYEIGTFSGCAIEGGALFCWGRNAEGQLGTGDTNDQLSPTRIGAIDDWEQVSVGRFHACVRRVDESIHCAGENVDGRLGTGDNDRRNTFTGVAILPM